MALKRQSVALFNTYAEAELTTRPWFRALKLPTHYMLSSNFLNFLKLESGHLF